LRALDDSAAYDRLRTGRIECPAYLAEVARELGHRYGIRMTRILDDWYRIERVAEAENVALARALQKAGHAVVLASNASAGMADRLAERYGTDIEWDAVMISGTVGVAKPDPRYLREAASRVGFEPSACF
jgi:FMN phosphatase YigB (HAD superfamily)